MLSGAAAYLSGGLVKEFTGISDPYESPEDADLTIDTSDTSPEEAAQQIFLHMERDGYVA
jgi:sulfate adenylyltransferase